MSRSDSDGFFEIVAGACLLAVVVIVIVGVVVTLAGGR